MTVARRRDVITCVVGYWRWNETKGHGRWWNHALQIRYMHRGDGKNHCRSNRGHGRRTYRVNIVLFYRGAFVYHTGRLDTIPSWNMRQQVGKRVHVRYTPVFSRMDSSRFQTGILLTFWKMYEISKLINGFWYRSSNAGPTPTSKRQVLFPTTLCISRSTLFLNTFQSMWMIIGTFPKVNTRLSNRVVLKCRTVFLSNNFNSLSRHIYVSLFFVIIIRLNWIVVKTKDSDLLFCSSFELTFIFILTLSTLQEIIVY